MRVSKQNKQIYPQRFWKSRGFRIALLGAIIVMVSVSVYLNTYKAEFVWDDEYLIINNPQIKSFSHLGSIFKTYLGYGSENCNNFYRPVQELSDMIDYRLWKLDPSGYHLTNIILHSFVTLAVFIVFIYISGSLSVSFISALFYGICPLHTESVAYIAGRADMLYSLFLLLSLLFFIKSVSHREKTTYFFSRMIFSAGFFAFALLSKETALIFPGLLFLYLLNFKPEELKIKRAFLLLGPFLLITLAYIILRKTYLDFSDISPVSVLRNIPFPYRFLTFLSTVPVYLRLIIFPVDLHMERIIPVVSGFFSLQSILSISIFSLIVFTSVTTYKKNLRIVSFGLQWFLISLIPVSNIFPINAFIAEHWLYVPSIGLFLIFGYIVVSTYRKLPKNKYHLNFLFGLAILLTFISYSCITVIRNRDWRDEISFFKSTLAYHPDDPRLYLNLGNTYFEKDQLQDAIYQYKKSIELKKDYFVAYGNIGSVYLKMGLMDKAETYLDRAIELQNVYPIAHYNRGIIYFDKREFKKAIIEFKQAVDQMPQLYDAYNLIAHAYMNIGDRPEAVKSLERSLAIMPDQPEIRSILDQLTR